MSIKGSTDSGSGDIKWTPTERRLAAIWAEVLTADRKIEREDAFLSLGGESIAATLCLNRVRQTFNVTVPLRTLLSEGTTLRTLASLIDASAVRSR